jgi:hypothetical protein
MKKRGRKTENDLLKPVELTQKRPPPPAGLNADMGAIWIRVTGCFPPDYFRPADWPLLESYCRHVYRAAVIDRQLDAFENTWLRDDDGLRRYRTLLEARKGETQLITSLARSMRITHQSRVHKDTAARLVEKTRTTPAPWEY